MKPMKALIFGENKMFLTLLTEILPNEKFEVTAFSDPISFINQHEESCCHKQGGPCFDVLITDNLMPGMTGIEFIEGIKGFGCKLADQRKAIVSDNWSADDLKHAKKTGSKVFHNPVPRNKLIQWLADCREDAIPSISKSINA
jgi:CheY-like chemotaxis protein